MFNILSYAHMAHLCISGIHYPGEMTTFDSRDPIFLIEGDMGLTAG